MKFERPLNVLFVEDNPDDAELEALEIRRSGIEVYYERVETFEAMTEAMKRVDWDIVISDYSMPNFSSLEALKTVQETGKDIPCFVVTGTVGEEYAVQVMRAGAHDYILKNNLTRLVPAIERELAEVEERWARRQAEKRLARQNLLNKAVNRLLKETLVSPDEEDLAKTALALAEELTVSEFGFIGEVNPKGLFDSIAFSEKVIAVWGLPENKVYSSARNMTIGGLWGTALIDGKSLIANEPKSHPKAKGFPPGHPPINSFIAVPFKHTGERKGLLALANKAGGYTLDDQALLEAFTNTFKEAYYNKKTEKQLADSETKFRGIVEQSYDGIYLLAGNKCEFVNRRMAEMLGYEVEELCGKEVHFLDFTAPKYKEAIAERIQKTENGEPVPARFEVELLTKSGKPIFVEVSEVNITFEGKKAVQGVARDLTEYKKLQHQYLQAQKMEVVGQLAGGVAHDFNNLLTVIGGNATLAMMDSSEEHPLYHNLEQIQKAAKRSAELTKQLLAFSRRQILEPKVVNLNEVLKDFEKMMRRMLREDIHYEIKPASDLGNVKVDIGQMEQIIMNLTVNARDAMPKSGKIVIETANVELGENYVREHPDVIEGEYVMMSVSDNGCGMTPEVKERIFEPFFTTKETGKGTGLGLSTVFGIVKQSKGHISVYSEVGMGTTFKIYFPCIAEKTEAVGKKVKVQEIPRGSETVLLVEDSEDLRELTARMLRGFGYAVLTAEDGAAGLKIFANLSDKISLLITDLVMPKIGGYELAKRCWELKPSLKALMMSGYSENIATQEEIAKNGALFLAKPFEPAALARRVRETLDKKSE